MSKRLLSAVFACCSLAGAQQTFGDATGVTVNLNGAELLHRPAISYPAGPAKDGVRGLVLVQVKLDSTGMVSDASVLSGPDEFRKSVLQSVLQWHFTHEFASNTRTVQIDFAAPPAPQPPRIVMIPRPRMVPAPLPTENSSARIQKISVNGLLQHSAAELTASLPVREGDAWNLENLRKVIQAAHAYDEHLTVQMMRNPAAAAEAPETDLVIATPESGPTSVKVGGNVQNTMVVNKVQPVYPPDAKAAHISGVVHLSVIIGTDGTVQALTVLDGPQQLTQAAVDAVKQWVYRPTLLNGNPVEVETTTDINFTLNQ